MYDTASGQPLCGVFFTFFFAFRQLEPCPAVRAAQNRQNICVHFCYSFLLFLCTRMSCEKKPSITGKEKNKINTYRT